MLSLLRSKIKPDILIVLLCLLILIGHLVYISLSRQYPQWDEHHYLSMAVRFVDELRQPSLRFWEQVLVISGSRQPFLGLLFGIPLLFVGTLFTYKLALSITALLFVVTVYGTYVLARSFLSPVSSFLAAIVYVSYGNALFYSHFTYSEMAVTACIVWAMACVLRSRQFTGRKEIFWGAVFFAAAWLTRWVAPVFGFVPIAVYCFSSFLKTEKKKRVQILNNCIMFFVVGFGVPVLLYYFPNRDVFLDYVVRNQDQGAAWVAQYKDPALANTFSTRSLMYYFNILSQNSIFHFALFGVGLLISLLHLRTFSPLVGGFIGAYAFLTFITVWKEDRFIVPVYPLMAIISAVSFDYIKKLRARHFAIFAVFILAIVSYSGAMWGRGPMGQRGLHDIVLPQIIHHPRRIYLTSLVWPPVKEYINAHQVVEYIENNYPLTTPLVVQLFTFEPFDNALISFVQYHDRPNMQLKQIADQVDEEELMMLLTASDILLLKSNSTIHLSGTVSASIDAGYVLKQGFLPDADIFVPADGSIITIYKHIQ